MASRGNGNLATNETRAVRLFVWFCFPCATIKRKLNNRQRQLAAVGNTNKSKVVILRIVGKQTC